MMSSANPNSFYRAEFKKKLLHRAQTVNKIELFIKRCFVFTFSISSEMPWYFILLSTTFYALSKSDSIPETMQTIAVRGQLKCAQKNVINTLVTLEIDIRFVDEQVLAIARTNSTGWFELKANILSTDIVRPFFHVHIGQSSGIKCRQRYKQSIPFEFITKYDQPERWYDAGIIDLQDICVKLPDETSCLNKDDLSFMTTESSGKDINTIY